MADCKWMQDEICVNADCPMRADFCPVADNPGVCRFEEREDVKTMAERCVCCGDIIPEGRQVCFSCEKEVATMPITEAATKWIPVTESLPKDYISVIGYMTDAGDFPSVRECYAVKGEFYFPALREFHPVSHWMPLPGPPDKEGANNA